MELQKEQQQAPPPAYSHDPEQLHLPSVPSQDVVSRAAASIHLPDLKSLGLPDATLLRTQKNGLAGYDPSHNNTLPPLTSNGGGDGVAATAPQWRHGRTLQSATFPRVPATELRAGESDVGSPRVSVMSIDDALHVKSASITSIEDPDVRLAAEGLSALGNPDFVRSPSSRSATLPPSLPLSGSTSQDPEPLLSLLTSSHPWIGGTINGSLSAYSSTKNYSPRFVRYGAEFVERNLGSPVVNTVSSMGKRTGVEGSLRRYLGGNRRAIENPDAVEGANGNKRRKTGATDADEMDIEKGLPSPLGSTRMRCDSQSSHTESLPAYDDHRSPSYEEFPSTNRNEVLQQQQQQPASRDEEQNSSQRANWSTQLMITTSGLGVALSDSSLISLKACLGLLRGATQHVDGVMGALKVLLEDYEKAMQSRNSDSEMMDIDDQTDQSPSATSAAEREERCREIADKIKVYGEDIWRTVKGVVNSVSRQTGGVLPENAGVYVRSQLMSVPQRWRSAAQSTANRPDGTDDVQNGAHRVLAFAKEGLDMMAQVSRVVDGTVVSAETWIAKMGKKPTSGEGETGQSSQQQQQQQTPREGSGEKNGSVIATVDEKMGL